MSRNSIIKCDLCGYQFNVYQVTEQHIEDYEYVDVDCYYPLPEENAHLVHNYICDACYNNIGKIVKDMLLKTGEEFVNKLEERKDKAYKEYLKIINKLENETQIVQWYHDVLVDCSNLLNLNVETIHDISSLSSDKYPWSKGTYYLDKAIEIEKINKLGMKEINDWTKQYNIKIKKLPKEFNTFTLVTKDEFKNILLDSEVENMTLREVIELVNNLQ
jgi:hypothetical protein